MSSCGTSATVCDTQGNLTEFTVCVAKLLEVDRALRIADEVHYEFVAISVVYTHRAVEKHRSPIELLIRYRSLPAADQAHPLVRAAVGLINRAFNGDTVGFFAAVRKTTFPPVLNAYVRGHFIPAVRAEAMRQLFRGSAAKADA